MTDSIREVVKTLFDAFGLVVIVVSSAICAPLSSTACSPRDRRHLRSPHADARTPRDAMPV
jgi:hypothetical protein